MAADSGHKVEVSDTTALTVSYVAITSDPGDDDSYGLGDAIQVTVTFSEDVTVAGAPQLELDFDGTAKTADYSSTDGAAVVFSYTVAQDESDADGIAIGADKLSLNGGAIKDGADNAATLTHDAVAADSGHKVDGSDSTDPTISSLSFTSDPGDDSTYGTDDTIQVTVTFSENVIVTGAPQLELNMSNSCGRPVTAAAIAAGPMWCSSTRLRWATGRVTVWKSGQQRYADALELFCSLRSLRERRRRPPEWQLPPRPR